MSAIGMALSHIRPASRDRNARAAAPGQLSQHRDKDDAPAMDGTSPEIDDLLARLEESHGSDLHIKYGARPFGRIDGTMQPLDDAAVGDDAMAGFIERVIPADLRDRVHRGEETECSYHSPGVGRFRISAFRQRGELSMVMRRLADAIPTTEELGLPPAVGQLAELQRGLVLVSGATGSGKSTTLSAIVGQINATRREHIITIEDPIEYVHADDKAVVSQREIGSDTPSFTEALRRALRQDPDVILVGELREPEAVATAIRAADTGHLVLSTVHTNSAAESITRLIEFFPEAERELMRQMFVASLCAVVSQRLVPKVGGGRVAAVEVLINTPRISDLLIKQDMTEEAVTEAMADGAIHGMQSFDQHLVELVRDGTIEESTAFTAATAPHDFGLKLKEAQRQDRAETLEQAAASTRPTGLRTAADTENGAA